MFSLLVWDETRNGKLNSTFLECPGLECAVWRASSTSEIMLVVGLFSKICSWVFEANQSTSSQGKACVRKSNAQAVYLPALDCLLWGGDDLWYCWFTSIYRGGSRDRPLELKAFLKFGDNTGLKCFLVRPNPLLKVGPVKAGCLGLVQLSFEFFQE